MAAAARTSAPCLFIFIAPTYAHHGSKKEASIGGMGRDECHTRKRSQQRHLSTWSQAHAVEPAPSLTETLHQNISALRSMAGATRRNLLCSLWQGPPEESSFTANVRDFFTPPHGHPFFYRVRGR